MIFGGIVLYVEYQRGIAPPYIIWGVICILGAILYATHRHDPKAVNQSQESAWDSSANEIGNLGPTGLTWHCSCGEINVKSAETCKSCGADRPTGS